MSPRQLDGRMTKALAGGIVKKTDHNKIIKENVGIDLNLSIFGAFLPF
jgi:hypothetical protein